MQCDFRETLLLEIPNDSGALQRAALDHRHHHFEAALEEGEFEYVLGGVDLHLTRLALAIECMEKGPIQLGEVERRVEGSNHARVAIGQTVLDVVERRINQDSCIIPHRTLHTHGFMDGRCVLQLLPCNHHRMLAQQRDLRHVGVPNNVFDRRRRHLRRNTALLDVEQDQLVLGPAQQHSGAGVEDGIGAGEWRRHLLRDFVLQIPDVDRVGGSVQGSEAVARDEYGAGSKSALALGHVRSNRLLRHIVQLERSPLQVAAHQHAALRRIVRQRLGTVVGSDQAAAADRDQSHISLGGRVEDSQVPVADIEDLGALARERRTLPLQFKDNHARVVACSQEVHLRVGSQHPEPIMLPSEGVDTETLRHVPNADGFVLGIGHDQVLATVEHHARHVVGVAAEGVHFPGLALVVPPQLDLSVISAGDNKG
mmetsp:Transcript_23864/g.42558  ORF Transcript_23864/g.42558 Transcript_23864/m.42558 type:complete len:426 (+) Transcript_23864:695-1972(+)